MNIDEIANEIYKQKLSGTDNSNSLPMKFSLKGYPSGNYIVIDGELRPIIDATPPNIIPLKGNAGILNRNERE